MKKHIILNEEEKWIVEGYNYYGLPLFKGEDGGKCYPNYDTDDWLYYHAILCEGLNENNTNIDQEEMEKYWEIWYFLAQYNEENNESLKKQWFNFNKLK